MRERVTVLTYTEARDAAGQNVETDVTLLSKEPARFIPVGGGTSYRGQQLQEDVIAVFEMRYRSILENTQLRIVHAGTTYGVTRASRVDGGTRYLAMFCRGVAA